MKRKFLKILSLALTAAVLSAAAMVPGWTANGEGPDSGPEKADPVLSLDKEVYEEDEDLFVTADGSGKDWVGLYRKGEIPGTGTASIYWYYVADEGNTPNTPKNIREAEHCNSGREDWDTVGRIAAGEYIVYLCADDGYGIIASAPLTVKTSDKPPVTKEPQKPASVAYKPSGDVSKGLAEGFVTVNLAEKGEARDVFLYWGDETGTPLPDYTFLTMAKVPNSDKINLKLPKNLVIPEGAKSIAAVLKNEFGLSEREFVLLPDNAAPVARDGLLYTFAVCSDIHVDPDVPLHNRHFEDLLLDIRKAVPDCRGVMAVGDIANHGYQAEYDLVKEILNKVPDHPEFHWVIGNHDVSYGQSYESQLKRFNEFSGNTEAYFDFWLEGHHFIFLAGSTAGGTVPISKEETEWLRKTIAENASPDKPIFLFCHESIQDTVAGSTAQEGWWGIQNGKEIAEILRDYPQAIFFNGHSHWLLSSKNEMYSAGPDMCNAFNTSSVGYLWTGYNIVTGEAQEGAEALYVEVYGDKVLVRGRDVVNGKWDAACQYRVKLASGSGSPDGGEETAQPTQAPDKKSEGCGSVLGAAVLPLLTSAFAAMTIRRKKNEA